MVIHELILNISGCEVAAGKVRDTGNSKLLFDGLSNGKTSAAKTSSCALGHSKKLSAAPDQAMNLIQHLALLRAISRRQNFGRKRKAAARQNVRQFLIDFKGLKWLESLRHRCADHEV
jgi:hypothetical protein